MKKRTSFIGIGMRKTIRIVMAMLLSISVLSTWANPVDIRQAQVVAAKFAKANLNQRTTSSERILLGKVYSMSDGRSACYVFNLDPGFVIVAADDCAVPILGYSEDNRLDSDHIPIQMDVYIKGFVKQLQYGVEKGIAADPDVAAQWASIRQTGCINGQKADRSLGPLLSTQWDQGCYYNNKCPVDNNGDCGRVAVGCVATAMGQVLRYWGYPATGQGTHSYTPDGYATQTVNYGATTYNWNNMPNRLGSSSSSTQINAISTLLWHCGVGVEMKYGAEISWAYFDNVITALQDHFRFPLGMFADWRTDQDTWLALLKGCLNHNCPVYYTAQDDNDLGGHAFVCDGYDSNNYFHFNWGWSGEGDGYFALNALNLFGYEYNTDHYAIFNMAPDPIVLQQNVSASPSNGGNVSGSGSYYFGNTCTLNATANTGYSFVCWKKNGVQISTNPRFSFRVVDSDSYVAVFSPNSCNISASASPSAGGTVSGGGSYNYGSNCTLTATPATGYSFVRWTKNGSQVSTNASYSFTVTENANYVAVFSLNSYTISASANPSAGGTVSGGGSYNSGSTCTLTATANSGYTFNNWTENGEVVSAETSYSFTVTRDRNLVANFAEVIIGCNITFNLSDSYGDGWNGNYLVVSYGDVTQQLTFERGSSASYTLQIPDHIHVELAWISGSWTDECSFTINYENGNVIYFGSNMSVDFSWSFDVSCEEMPEATFDITTMVNLPVGGFVSGAGEYAMGSTCTLTATANDGYFFMNWTENGEVISTVATYSFTVIEDRDLVANFVVDEIIIFADANVKALCVQNWDTNGDGELCYTEAAAVTDLGEVFQYNSTITSFEELRYFTGLTSICQKAFYYCRNLSSVCFPHSLTSIGQHAFSNCGLSTIDLPNSLVSIDAWAFSGCPLTTVVIPSSVHSISNNPFIGCSQLEQIIVDPENTEYDSRDNCNAIVRTYSNWLMVGCKNSIITNTIRQIGQEAFKGCTGLASITIPNTITKIQGFAFDGCSGLKTISIPNSVNSIDVCAFYGCTRLTGELIIPNSVTTIGSQAFQGCSGLTSISLGSTVSSIGRSAFADCNGLQYVTALSDNPPTGTGSLPTSIPLYVPCTSVDSYQSGDDWSAFSTIIGLCDSGTITLTASPAEAASLVGQGTYESGSLCNVSASTNENYSFMYWTDNEQIVSTNVDYSFTVTTDRNLVAHFSLPLNVNAVADPMEGGIIAGMGNYDYGEICTLTAMANDGYSFMYWTEDGNQVSTDNRYSFFVTSSRDLVAHFTLPLTITATVDPIEGSTISGTGEYVYNTTCTLTAPAMEGYTFIKWTKNGNVVSYISPYSFTVTENADYVAHFEETPGFVVGTPELIYMSLPSSALYNYTLTQQIYTPEEIGGNTIITNLSFFNTGGQKTRNYDIYIVHTDKNTFDSNTDWIAVMEADRVFSGNVTMLAGRWSTIVLDTPFAYNGTSNLAIVVDDNSGNFTYQPYMDCRVFNVDGNQSIRVYGDNTNYDPMSPPSSYASGNYAAVLSVKNQILINTSVYNVSAATNISDSGSINGTGSYGFGQTCVLTATANEGYCFYYWTENGNVVSTNANYTFTVTSDRNLVGVFGLPLTITASANLDEGGVVFGTGGYDYNTTCTLTATANEGYSFVKWTKNGNVVSYVSPYSFTVTEEAEYVAHFEEISDVVVGTPELTNVYLPSYSYYKYTLSQQIYTPAEIGATGFISSIGYFNAGAIKTRNYDIYMVHTDKMVFDNINDWITVTEADLVFSGEVTMENGGWTTIILDTPFAYNGTSNLAIVVDDNSGNWTGQPHMDCRVFNTEGNQAIRVFSDYTNYDPMSPPSSYVSFDYAAVQSLKNQVVFKILPIYHYISNGTWGNAANWSGGIMPGINDAVSIDANCALNKDVEVALLAITPGKTLTIRSGKTLTVTGTLANKATTGLVIKEGGQLINASGKVAATMEKGISAHDGASTGWYTIASPMNGMPIAGSDFVMPEYDLYRFNETNLTFEEWENYKANFADFTAFEKGRGYLYANSNDFTSTFTGILNAFPVTYFLTCTNRPNDPLGGFHLIGNPFPHEIYKGAGGAIDNANLASGYYTLDAEGVWQVHSFDDAILPGQGILVKATAPTTLTIAKSTEEAFAESGEAKMGRGMLRISVVGDNGQDRAYVYFGHGIDLDKAKSLDQSALSLAIHKESGDFAIAHFDKKSDAIELVFTTPESGSVTLDVKADANDFEYLHMVDMFTGADIDLLQQSSYTFDASGQAGERHFMLRYNQLDK